MKKMLILLILTVFACACSKSDRMQIQKQSKDNSLYADGWMEKYLYESTISINDKIISFDNRDFSLGEISKAKEEPDIESKVVTRGESALYTGTPTSTRKSSGVIYR